LRSTYLKQMVKTLVQHVARQCFMKKYDPEVSATYLAKGILNKDIEKYEYHLNNVKNSI